MSLLQLKELSKTYHSANHIITVLKRVSLQIQNGERCALIGPSGSGKTTLLALAAGLDTPSEGSVILDGQHINQLSEDQRAALRNRSVGFIFQNFQLIPSLTALENVMLPAELLAAQSLVHIEQHATQLLIDVGLRERVSHYPVQLSGGEQQRVGIARALINEPKIIFADEPTGNLDGESASHVLDLLIRINDERATSILCVTHDQRVADRMHRSMEVRNGELVDP